MKKLLMFGLCLVLVSGLALSANAEVPLAPTEDIKMALTDKPVVFSHVIHENAEVACEACHHPVAGTEAIQYVKCSTAGCHDILDSKDKSQNSYYRAFHDRTSKFGYDASCIKCHTEVAKEKPEMKKALTSCKGSSCHA